MRRVRVVGLCVIGALAISAVAVSSASAAAPEFGRCIKKATKGGEGYSNAGCTLAVSASAKYEWAPGPGPKPKFTSTTRYVFPPQHKYCERGLAEAKIAEEDRALAAAARARGEIVLAEKYESEAAEHEAAAATWFKKAKLEKAGCEKLIEEEKYDAASELETVGGLAVTCARLSSEGEYTGAKTVGDLTTTFYECEHSGIACQSPGAEEGVIVSSTLDGELGVISSETKEGETKIKTVGIGLFPATGSVVSEIDCGPIAITVTGSVIHEVATDKMITEEVEEFSQSKGKQKPERFAGGELDVLESSFGGQSGLELRGTLVNEEAIEVNRVV